MNFAQAVKGHKAKIKISIWSQAETELGRKPTPEEQKLAVRNTSPEKLLEEIEKVICFKNLIVIHFFSASLGLGASASKSLVKNGNCHVQFLSTQHKEMETV